MTGRNKTVDRNDKEKNTLLRNDDTPHHRHCEEPRCSAAKTGDEAVQKSYKHYIMKQPAVYIMASERNGTLYTGVTSNLPKRIYEHKNSITGGFTSKYKCTTLVYYAVFDDMTAAITEEKRLKGGNRKKKITLIETTNPDWQDLYGDITT